MITIPAGRLAACHTIDNADILTPGQLAQAAYEACICPDVTPDMSGTLASLAAYAYTQSLAVPAVLAA